MEAASEEAASIEKGPRMAGPFQGGEDGVYGTSGKYR